MDDLMEPFMVVLPPDPFRGDHIYIPFVGEKPQYSVSAPFQLMKPHFPPKLLPYVSRTGHIKITNNQAPEVAGVNIQELWDLDARNLSRNRRFKEEAIRVSIVPFSFMARPFIGAEKPTMGFGLVKVEVGYASTD